MKRREQTKPSALDEDQCEVQRSEVYDGDHDVLQPNVKFESLGGFRTLGSVAEENWVVIR
jgi:hypothetical protein